MARHGNEGLARAVRRLREHGGMTQEQLGRAAGYRTGAGVAISRVESGLLRPSPERFAGIATALGLSPAQLQALADEPVVDQGPTASPPARVAKGPAGQKELDARWARIQQETGERARAMAELGDAFNQAHDRARAEFFQRLVEVAARVQGAPPVDAAWLPADDDADTGPAAAAGVGTGGAAARLQVSRGARRGAVLVGVVAAPLAMLAASGIGQVRGRRERQEREAQLDEAEAELAAARPGIEALRLMLTRARDTLDYLATHAGHALARWDHQLGPGPLTWDALSRADRRRYQDFFDVADAEIAISTFDFPGLLLARGREQEQLVQLADDVLARAHEVVTARV